MGSNQFQREYIEYLQKKNTELLNRMNQMKENYENKILSKDLNKQYLVSTLGEVLNVCSEIPQEIDLFFDKITAAVDAFKDILLRKSQLVQMVEKISRVLGPSENFNADLIAVCDSDLVKEKLSESRINKKAGTVKVSPMIKGHIISTEPRIFLSRIPGVLSPERIEAHQLSPIIEASPDTSPDPSNTEGQVFREIRVPIERINLNKLSYNYIGEESPKSRFKGPKTWKKSLSSNKRISDSQKNTGSSECNEYLNKKLSLVESEVLHESLRVDPLEGPSWLHGEHSEITPSSSPFRDYRRRKHRFATVFDKNEDSLNCFEKELKKVPAEVYENHEETSDEEEDFKEIKSRKSDSSDDYVQETISSEESERLSQLRIKHVNSGRNCKSDSIKFAKRKKSSTSNPKDEEKSASKTHINADSPIEGDNEDNPMQKLKEHRESLKLSGGKISSEISFESTPRKSEYLGVRMSKKSKSSIDRSPLLKDALENNVIVQLQDSVASDKNSAKRSASRSSSEKKTLKNNKSRSKSKSPMVVSRRNEGRVKRKAAPSFKLVEPKLGTKLRRQ